MPGKFHILLTTPFVTHVRGYAMDKQYMSPFLQYLVGAGAIVLIVAGLKVAAPIITPILVALLLAFSVTPIFRWFASHKVKPGIALLLTLLVVLAGSLIVVSITTASIVRLVDSLPKYESGLNSLKMSVLGLLSSLGIDPSGIMPEGKYNPEVLIKVATSVLGVALDLLSNGLIVVLIMAFILVELRTMFTVDSASKVTRTAFQKRIVGARDDVVRYVSITGWNGFLNAVGNLVLLVALGVDFPVAWALLSFLCNFIPTFGFIVALIPPALLAYLESGWLTSVLVVGGYVLLNFVFENIVKPRTMKKGLEISPLLTILSVIVWTWILGPAGTVLAVPLTVTLQKLVVEQIEGPTEGRAKGGQ
jgi:AI-2 transport protein TqsA